MRQWLGSIVFTVYLFVSVPIYGTLVLLTAPLPRRVTYRASLLWVDSVLWLLRVLCRLDYRVEGREHLPQRNGVVLLKHSSATSFKPLWPASLLSRPRHHILSG
jgi:1-acyl-sn-glycerol-3-phosphate acyltransferase